MLFFKLLGKRGAAITEYAVLLAFVAVIATSFTKSDGLEDSMRGFISRVEKTVGVDNNYPEDTGGSSGEGSTEAGGSGGGDSGNTGGGNTSSGTENGGSSGGDNGNTGGGGETGGSIGSSGGNYGFVDTDTEDAYKGVVDSLIDYLLDHYYGPNLKSAEIKGKNCKIQYKDGNGEIKTKTITFEGNKNFEAAGYEVQNADLSFVDGALDTRDYDSINIHIKGTDQKDNTWLKMNSDHKFYVK